MKTIRDLLSEPWPGGGTSILDEPVLSLLSSPPTKLEIVAALAAIDTGGYGVISYGGPEAYGVSGLTHDQAFAWTGMRGFIDGVLYATDDEARTETLWLKDALQKEHARVRALLAERRAAKTEAPPEAP